MKNTSARWVFRFGRRKRAVLLAAEEALAVDLSIHVS
jgi:hypothetical protein